MPKNTLAAFIVAIIFFHIAPVLGQESDSLLVQHALPDFDSPADSLRYWIERAQRELPGPDSTKGIGIAEDSLEIVSYQADSIRYFVDGKTLQLRGKVDILYDDIRLTSGNVVYHLDSRTISAEEEPVLYEGDDQVVGERMRYNLKSRQGEVEQGRSQYEDGYYAGQRIRKPDRETLLISDGFYTTCDMTEPHYCFRSKRMKLLIKDKVIAQPVILYIGDVPLFALPFFIFPIRTGRVSGFLTPRVGNNNVDGRYIKNLGYYWATNDYMDLTARVSIRERTGLEMGADYVYIWRHHLSGKISADYDWEVGGEESSSTRWRLTGSHRQTFREKFTLTASANFVSSKDYYRQTSDLEDQRTEGLLRSSFTLDKSWGQARIKLAGDYTHNLITDVKTGKIPDISVSYSRSNLLNPRRGSGIAEWSPVISFSSRSTFYHKLTKEPCDSPEADADSLAETQSRFVTAYDWTAQHQFSLSFSVAPRIVHWLNLTLRSSLTDSWRKDHEETIVQECATETEEPRDDNSQRLTPGNLSLTGNSAIYGIFRAKIGKMQAIRHTIRPSIFMNYDPGFYFEDRNYGFDLKKIESNPASKFSVSSIRLSNLFEAKMKEGGDKSRNVQLFTMDFASSYKKQDQEWRFSNISGNLSTRINALSVTANSSYHLYEKKFGTGTMNANTTISLNQTKVRSWVDRILKKFHPSPDISVSDSLSLEDKNPTPDSLAQENPAQLPGKPDDFNQDNPFYQDQTLSQKPKKSAGISRWDISMTHSYRRTFELSDREGAVHSEPQSNLIAKFKLQLTKNWDVSYQNRYNLTDKKTVSQRLDIYRDLHCWQARFSWTSYASGTWNSYFIVNIKKLSDIKVEHRESRRSN
ncbi:MAG: hypothetical protein B6244_13065 [Candidatus Cloacimonetes bacterium 4572_55]|nr:MAG: hypothetical protein B6244_13065 [Candidatus Cloacimonetes bacterium 4572_55]